MRNGVFSKASNALSSPLVSRLVISVAAIWFGASILSQALYMGFYGIPYDSMLLLEIMGPYYALIIVIELLIWAMIGLMLVNRFLSSKLGIHAPTTVS